MPAVSVSAALRRKIELVRFALRQKAGCIWAHPQVRQLYPEVLLLQHSIMRASVPLMEAACLRANSLGDPLSATLSQYFGVHAREELHHDEWLVEDLQLLGFTREQVLGRLSSSTVAALVGSQYYWIHHVHPVALLGYIAVLEGEPPSISGLEDLVARTGLPHAAFRTYFKHAQLDPQHRADLDTILDTLPLTSAQQSLLGVNAIQTVALLTCAFEEVLQQHIVASSATTGAGS